MQRHPIRKSFVALATVLSFVLLISAPASADAEITSGTLYVGGSPASPTFTFPLGEDAEDPPCVAVPNTVKPFQFHVDKEIDGSGVWWTTGGFAGVAEVNNLWLKAEFDFGGLGGTFVPGPPGDKVLSGGGTIGVTLFLVGLPEDPEDPCDKVLPICSITVDVFLFQPSFYEGPNPPAPGGELNINADSLFPHIQTSDCLISDFDDEPAFIRDLLITL